MFIFFAVISELIYLFLAIKSEFFGLLDLHDNSTAVLIVVLLSILFICYFCTYRFTKWKKVNIRTIFVISLLFHITFLFIPFLTSNDLFTYIFQTRIFPYLGGNPYLDIYNVFPQD